MHDDHEITEQIISENGRGERRLFRTLLETCPAAISIVGPDGL